MVEFATQSSGGDKDQRDAILDDILYALFENYQCVGRVSRIDYADIEAVAKDQSTDELEDGEIRVNGLRAFVHFHEWWNTTTSMVIRNSVEANSKQWQIRGHVDQYDNEYGFIVVKKNEKQIKVELKQEQVEEPKFKASELVTSMMYNAQKLVDLEKENAELKERLTQISQKSDA